MKTVYQCEACKHIHESPSWIFKCIACGKEICEDCMYGYATCVDCSKLTSDGVMKQRFEDNCGW